MTYDLHTSCNGSDMEMTMLYRVAPIKKYVCILHINGLPGKIILKSISTYYS